MSAAAKQKLADAFGEFLASRGLRLTPERLAVSDAVAGTKGHFDPEELHYTLRQNGSKASRASVYRTIPLLIEAGIIEEADTVDAHAHYEVTFGRDHHDHMVCTNCGKAIEFLSDELEALQESITKAHGFEGQTHSLEIRGLCSKCRAH